MTIDRKYINIYNQWKGKDGYLHCPRCHSINVAHVAVAGEGDLLMCVQCRNEAKIGDEDKKIRKGLDMG